MRIREISVSITLSFWMLGLVGSPSVCPCNGGPFLDSVQKQGQRSALSLLSTLLLRMRLSVAHEAWVLPLVLAWALEMVRPAPRSHQYQSDHSSPAENQGRADPSPELDQPRRLPGYRMRADG